MRVTLIFLIISLISCKESDRTNMTRTEIYTSTIQCYLRTDSAQINQMAAISEELMTFIYYQPEYVDGLQAPPPKPGVYLNEHFFDTIEHFQTEQELNHIKYQIQESNISTDSNPVKLGFANGKEENDNNSWYYFNLPIFNIDSTYAYIQRGYYNNGYEDGLGIIIRTDTKNNNCEVVERLNLWMN